MAGDRQEVSLDRTGDGVLCIAGIDGEVYDMVGIQEQPRKQHARILTLYFITEECPYKVGDKIKSGVRDGYNTLFEFVGEATVIEIRGYYPGPGSAEWEVKAIYYF